MMNPKSQITTAILIAALLCSSPDCSRYRQPHASPFIAVLGIVQDGGFPHAGCVKDCCADAWEDAGLRKHVVSLGIVDPSTSQCWIIDATPDFPDQLHTLTTLLESRGDLQFSGILLTHAHIGHYTGLMYLGRKISEIPHPFIIESMTRLGSLPLEERNKIHFIHFNHTNPVLKKNNPVQKQITSGGFRLAREGQFFEL